MEVRFKNEGGGLTSPENSTLGEPPTRMNNQASASTSTGAAPSQVNLASPKIDLSWKDAKYFPRKQSRVGEHYQVAELPAAGTFNPGEQSTCVMSWDPKKAADLCDEEGNLTILEAVPRNKREAALTMIAESNYSPEDDFVEKLEATPSPNGSDWTPEKRARFSELVFTLRKNLHKVRTEMEIEMSTCLSHYYAVFKHTNDYRLVKTVLQDEKFDKKTASQVPAVGEPDTCLICGDGGELLICDGCEGEYHTVCLDPPLSSVPEGHWECDECVNRKLLAFRDYLVRQSGLFEAKDLDRDDGGIIFKPTSSALTSVRAMAQGISKLVAPNTDDRDTDKPPAKAIKQEDSPADRKRAIADIS